MIPQFQVVDDCDQPLSNECVPEDIDRVAEGIATDRKTIVHYYSLNGRRVSVQPRPTEGAGCTIRYPNDRYAATVIGVSPGGRKVMVQEDTAIRTDSNGLSGPQEYTYERNPVGGVHSFYRMPDGTYRNRGKRLVLGVRKSYVDNDS